MPNILPIPGTPVQELPTPALILDLPTLERNIEVMHSFFRGRPAKVRSVTKGHKCPAIAQMQMSAHGAIPLGLCCAKISEAEEMVQAGARDIRMIEQIVGQTSIARLMNLTRHAHVIALVDHPKQVDDLSEGAQFFGTKLDVLVEVEIGLQRCGVAPGKPAVDLARYVMGKAGLHFKGLSGHESSSGIIDPSKRITKQRENFQRLLNAREDVQRSGIPVEICGGGATMAWNVAGSMEGITEIEPGAYIVMDYGIKQTAPDLEFGLALKILSTVISRPTLERAIIDCGHKMIGLAYQGQMPATLIPSGAKISRLHSEHGIMDLVSEARSLRIGDKVELIPWYYGSTANANDYYIGVRNERVECTWRIAARGCHQ